MDLKLGQQVTLYTQLCFNPLPANVENMVSSE